MSRPFIAPPPIQRSASLSWAYILFAIAGGIHLAALFQAVPLASANDRSRWATVWSLAERGTFRIDALEHSNEWKTIDQVQIDGHLYSTKPPLLAVMVAMLYSGLQSLTGMEILEEPTTTTHVLLLFVNTIPWFACWFVILNMVRKYATSRFTQAFVVGTSVFGTFLSTYSVTFNNHTVAAVSLIFALFFATRIIIDRTENLMDFALCGLTSAFVTTNELPAALFGIGIFGILLWKDWFRTLVGFAPFAALPVGAFLATVYFQTGTWKPFYFLYGTDAYIYIRDGLPSYWADPQGIDRGLDTPGTYFFHCILGHHGILSLTPVFFITVAGWFLYSLHPRRSLHILNMFGLVLTVAILLFYMTRTENYNYGGNTAALRWAIWLIPFWILGMIPILDAFGHLRWVRGTAIALLAISTYSAWESIDNPWKPSWFFSYLESNEEFDYSDPVPVPPQSPTLLISQLPEVERDVEDEWIELTATTERGQEQIRISTQATLADSVISRWMHTATTTNSVVQELEEIEATFNRENFQREAPPVETIRNAIPSVSLAIRRFQGLPATVNYVPREFDYVKVPEFEYAFHTVHSTGTVDVERSTGQIIRHRVDVWNCPDVPYGIVRILYTLQDGKSGPILQRRDFKISDAGRHEKPGWVQKIEALHEEQNAPPVAED